MSKMCARISSAVCNTDTSSLIASPLSFSPIIQGMGKEIKWVLGQGSGEDQPVERRAHYPEQRDRHVL